MRVHRSFDIDIEDFMGEHVLAWVKRRTWWVSTDFQ
jgi:hypothetical protein